MQFRSISATDRCTTHPATISSTYLRYSHSAYCSQVAAIHSLQFTSALCVALACRATRFFEHFANRLFVPRSFVYTHVQSQSALLICYAMAPSFHAIGSRVGVQDGLAIYRQRTIIGLRQATTNERHKHTSRRGSFPRLTTHQYIMYRL